jgi:uncharacterized protein (TIGR02118 family)
MTAVKAVVLYPRPEDKDAFERRYAEEHVPLCEEHLPGMTRLEVFKVLGSPAGRPAYYKVVELHYPSMDALQADFGARGGAKVAKHAEEISTGGPPTILITTA